jgi:two-component system, NtrC family, sensor kinase
MPKENSFDSEQLKSFDITAASAFVRSLAKSAENMEDLAVATTRYLFESLKTDPGLHKACALVRFFRTIEFQYLEPRLQTLVIEASGKKKPSDRCLTLLGTTGMEKNWNRRQDSTGHQVIPLVSPEMVEESPMIARLITQLGIEISSLFTAPKSPRMHFNDPKDRDYNIFYVPDATESPFIPSKSGFVIPYSIRSVIGYGSLLPSGDLYAVIMFFRILLPERIPKQFTALALSTTIAALSVPADALFAPTEES